MKSWKRKKITSGEEEESDTNVDITGREEERAMVTYLRRGALPSSAQ